MLSSASWVVRGWLHSKNSRISSYYIVFTKISNTPCLPSHFSLRCGARIGLVRAYVQAQEKPGHAKDEIGDIHPAPRGRSARHRGKRVRIVTRLWLVRHAPALTNGRIAGRRDVAADLTDTSQINALRQYLTTLRGAKIWSSPARRCQQTCTALGLTSEPVPDLWEQDFGLWEDIPATEIPDLGPLTPRELARYRPPDGESFDQMCARVCPVLVQASGPVVIVAHAGTARAAMSMVTGPAALSFAIASLSVTQMTRTPAGWAVECVNRTFS